MPQLVGASGHIWTDDNGDVHRVVAVEYVVTPSHDGDQAGH